MRTKLLPLLACTLGFLTFSCKKELPPTIQANKFTDIKVPDGFNWESSRDVKFKISVTDNRFMDAFHVIAIYDTDGKLLSKGSATINSAFESKIYLPSTVKEVYVIKTAPDNSNASQKVELTSDNINVSLGEGDIGGKNTGKTMAASPDCTSGCTQTITLSQNNESVTVEGGKTLCLSGSNKNFNVTFGTGGGTLRICGSNLTLQNVNKNSGSAATNIVTTSSSTVILPSLEFDKSNDVFENYGSCTVSGNLACSGTVNNFGSLTVNSDYNINSGSTLSHKNEGILMVKGTLNVNSASQLINNGWATAKYMQVNSNSRCYNNCKLYITDNLINDNILNNYGYIEVSGSTQINASALVNLYNGAIFQTKNMDKIGGSISGNGSTCLTKVTGTISQSIIIDVKKFKGSLEVCYPSALPSDLFLDGAKQDCAASIPTSGCNPGNGTAQISDADGDGVKDNLDDYPQDATKAYNNYYPAASSASGATVAFEDMWPVKGDYDMNDVVMSYRLKIITNAQNKVVGIDGDYNLYARGGIFRNGFGIEFPISRWQVTNVAGGILEEGQENAVIILFSNMQQEMYYMNTRKNEPTSPVKNYPVSFEISNGPTLADFGLGEYNPFIWNQGAGRGLEIHLPGKKPTSLANTSLFGTGDDRSSAASGKYYVTSEGYPWAISIPVSEFSYPSEGKDIISAYLKLPDWITSGGKNHPDWYLKTSVGFRNAENLYK